MAWQPGVTRQIGKKKNRGKKKPHTNYKNLGGQEEVTSLDADHSNEAEEEKQRNRTGQREERAHQPGLLKKAAGGKQQQQQF